MQDKVWYAPVYEENESAPLGRQLVMTPWMLLDRLKYCQEQLASLREDICQMPHSASVAQSARCRQKALVRLEELHWEMERTLRLLWRGGLWTDGAIVERESIEGHCYRVVCEPFTDGKPFGRPLSEAAPRDVREILGLPPR